MNSRTQQFPPQKGISRVPTQARRDRGANSKRLPHIEAAPVAFDVPIAAHMPEARETSNPTRDGEGVPKVVRCGQLPGCLPDGFNRESFLDRDQFCIWRGVSREWLKPRAKTLPGVVKESNKVWKIHVGIYLEKSAKGAGK